VTERAILMTGIGGQGVQLAARTLAVAAVTDGLEVMVFGEYGGSMRGGNTGATVVLGTKRLTTPPTVSRAWAALAMHHAYWPDVERRLYPGGVVVLDRSVFRGDVVRTDIEVVAVDASETATELGSAQAGSMVALGAFAAATGVVGIEALEAASAEVLPPYRAQHARANAAALRAGFALVPARIVDAWSQIAVPVQL
jgi:Pyruvate/2-oxoacid:ferredoxin oxidoreductase gamma subunit